MSGTQFGAGQKKETVYGGPTVATGNGNAYPGATKPVTETVYGGPGTGGTVYNPAQPDTTHPADADVSDATKKSANVFFLIAGFSLINTLLLSSGAMVATAIGLGVTRVFFKQVLSSGGDTVQVFALSFVLIAVFATLGVFARRGGSAAFLIGLLLYGADIAILCWDGIAMHVPSIVIHAIFLVGMFKGYRSTQA